MGLREYGGDESEKDEKGLGKVLYEFDCPVCNANNPYGDGFCPGDEIRCFYCGTSFSTRVDDNGKLKLREA